MTDIYEWLEDTHPPSYTPISPPFISKDGNHFLDIPTDEIMPLDIDEKGNMYFDYPHAQSQTGLINTESIPIDPSLSAMTNPQMTSMSDQAMITIPAHLADVSRKILVYLAQVIDIPESSGETVENTNFTTEELKVLEPIAEENFESSILNVINGVVVNNDP